VTPRVPLRGGRLLRYGVPGGPSKVRQKMRISSWSALGLALVALEAMTCQGHGIGSADEERECWDLWDCNPGRLCGEMVDCVHFRCLHDASPVLVPCPGDECVRDADCVLAQPYDCCNGCPQVWPRSALAELPCHYPEGEPVGEPPAECQVDCMQCPRCFPQPLGVRCELGRCVSVDQGCASTLDATPPEVTTTALLTRPDLYDGAEVLVVGTLLPGSLVCDDFCPQGEACCQAPMTIDGALALQGTPCDVSLLLEADRSCSDSFESEGPLVGATYAVAGRLERTGSPDIPFQLTVAGLDLRPFEGIEGAFDFTITQVQTDALDPSCVPPTLLVGDPGRLYVAESDGRVVAQAPSLDCRPSFLGSVDSPGRFSARVPVYCDECCCDYTLTAEVTGSRVFGVYEVFDGTCRYDYTLEGVRDPLPQPLPPVESR